MASFRHFLVLLCFVAAAFGQYYCVATTGGSVLRLRSSPSTTGNVVTNIPPGGRVRDLGSGLQSGNGYHWRYVEYQAFHGYSANEFLVPCAGPASPPPPAPSSQGNYIGCYVDNTARDLEDAYFGESTMTVEKCRAHCASKSFAYAGLQYGTECRCGAKYGQAGKANEADCDMPCGGDRSRMCGAVWRNSVYKTAGAATPAPAPAPPAPRPPPPPPPAPVGSKCQQIANIALQKVACGCPYVWGGTSCACGGHGGFDCSGIVYYSHRTAGLTSIPRTASQQMNGNGKRTSCTASNLAACKPGDLLFYCFPGGSACPNHVNMYAGDGKVVDCPHTGLNCRVLTKISYAKNFYGSRSYCS